MPRMPRPDDFVASLTYVEPYDPPKFVTIGPTWNQTELQEKYVWEKDYKISDIALFLNVDPVDMAYNAIKHNLEIEPEKFDLDAEQREALLDLFIGDYDKVSARRERLRKEYVARNGL